MAINFPNTPGNGSQHTASGITWTYDGTTWKADGVTSSYTLPTASSTVLGGVKVGSGLSINSGVLSTSGIALNNLSDVSTSGVQSGEILKYNGSSWAPAADSTYANSDVDTHLNQSNPTSGHVLSWNGSDYAWVAQSGGSSLAIQDEGSLLSTDATTLNFVGAGVTATGTGAVKTITIAGGGGGSPETTWTMPLDGGNYSFTGNGFPSATLDPTLYLIRGQTYKFVNNTGGHPFRIQTDGPTVGGGTTYDDGVTNQDAGNGVTLTFVVPMDAPDTLYYQCTAHTNMFGTINVITQGLSARKTATGTTASIANNTAADLTIAAAKTYVIHRIDTDKAAWVTLYTDSASRSNDSTRTELEDPASGSGVIAEIVTTGAAFQMITPGTIGFNYDNPASTNIYLKVVNKSGSTGTVQVTLTYLALEI